MKPADKNLHKLEIINQIQELIAGVEDKKKREQVIGLLQTILHTQQEI